MSIDVTIYSDGKVEYSGPHIVALPSPQPCPVCARPSPVVQACIGAPESDGPAIAGYTLICGHHFDSSVWRLRAVSAPGGMTMTLERR